MATQLTITPNFVTKTATVAGLVAVGEKVSMLILGITQEALEGLRVRIRFANTDVAMFPLVESDTWNHMNDIATGVIELNTVELRKVFEGLDDLARVTCTLVVENNGEVDNLYSIGQVTLRNWPAIIGDQVPPIDLGTWTDQIQALKDQILAMQGIEQDLSDFLPHNHTEGFGVTLDHDNLSGKGTNTHDQIDAALTTLSSAMGTYVGTVDSHKLNKSNPHEVTKVQIGLANADNTSDVNKPISNAVLVALATKVGQPAVNAHANRTDNPHGVNKAQIVGIQNVDNTSDVNKPVSTATRNAIDFHANATNDPHGTLTAWRNAFSGINAPTNIDGLFYVVSQLLAIVKA